ncbi:MAG: hypothetical protein ACKVOE_01830 [Rickettsiales bacterium]
MDGDSRFSAFAQSATGQPGGSAPPPKVDLPGGSAPPGGKVDLPGGSAPPGGKVDLPGGSAPPGGKVDLPGGSAPPGGKVDLPGGSAPPGGKVDLPGGSAPPGGKVDLPGGSAPPGGKVDLPPNPNPPTCDAACQEQTKRAIERENDLKRRGLVGGPTSTPAPSPAPAGNTPPTPGGNTPPTPAPPAGGGAPTTPTPGPAPAPAAAPAAAPGPAPICKEPTSGTSTSTSLDCDMRYRETVVTCDTFGTTPPCPKKPMPMKETPRKSFIKDYSPYLYIYATDPDDKAKAYTGPFYRGTPGDSGQTFQIFGAGGSGKNLAPCVREIKAPGGASKLSPEDQAKLMRLQLDNCANQYILHAAIYPQQKEQKEETRLFSMEDPKDPTKKVNLETHCQPLRLAKDTTQEYLASTYLEVAWKKLLTDPGYRKDKENPVEPHLPDGIKLENTSNANVKLPTPFPQVKLSQIGTVEYEEINDPTHPFSPRWDFKWNERDHYSPKTQPYGGDPKNAVFCAGDQDKNIAKVDILSFREERLKFDNKLNDRINFNKNCKANSGLQKNPCCKITPNGPFVVNWTCEVLPCATCYGMTEKNPVCKTDYLSTPDRNSVKVPYLAVHPFLRAASQVGDLANGLKSLSSLPANLPLSQVKSVLGSQLGILSALPGNLPISAALPLLNGQVNMLGSLGSLGQNFSLGQLGALSSLQSQLIGNLPGNLNLGQIQSIVGGQANILNSLGGLAGGAGGGAGGLGRLSLGQSLSGLGSVSGLLGGLPGGTQLGQAANLLSGQVTLAQSLPTGILAGEARNLINNQLSQIGGLNQALTIGQAINNGSLRTNAIPGLSQLPTTMTIGQVGSLLSSNATGLGQFGANQAAGQFGQVLNTQLGGILRLPPDLPVGQVSSLLGGLQGGLTNLNALGGGIGGAGGALGSIGGALGGLGGGGLSLGQIGSVFSTQALGLPQLPGNLNPAQIGAVFGSTGNLLGGIGGSNLAGIGSALSGIGGGGLGGIGGALGGLGGGGLGGIGGALGGLGGGGLGGIGGALGGLGGGGLGGIGGALGGLGGGGLGGIGGALGGLGGGGLGGIGGALGGLGGGGLGGIGGALGGLGAGSIPGIPNIPGLGNVASIANIGQLQGVLSGQIGSLAGLAGGTVSQLTGALSGQLGALSGLAGNLPLGSITGALGGIPGIPNIPGVPNVVPGQTSLPFLTVLAMPYQRTARCNPMEIFGPDNSDPMANLCKQLRAPVTMLNKLKMRYHNPDDKENIVLKEGVQEGLWFKDYFDDKTTKIAHMPYPRMWDTGRSIQSSTSTDQVPTDYNGQYTAIVGIGREATPDSASKSGGEATGGPAPAPAAGGSKPPKREDERCLYGGWGQDTSVAGASIKIPDPVTSWTEMKLYQARTLRYFGLSCFGRYEKLFKAGSTESLSLSSVGGEWGRTITRTCDDKGENCTAANRFGKDGDTLKDKAASANEKRYTQLLNENWPLGWRGYMGAKKDSNRFPDFGDSASTISGLDKAQEGDILLLPKGASANDGKPGLPRVGIVGIVSLASDCDAKKNCYVEVLEADNGKWPDVCGTTASFNEVKTRSLYRPGALAQNVKDELKDHVKWTTSCEDPGISACEMANWSDVKLYRVREDFREPCDKKKSSECKE